MINRILILFLFLNNISVIHSHNYIILADEEARDSIVRVSNSLYENRLREQSEINDYNSLPGTFWVPEEPIIIDGVKLYTYGYIFLENNWIISVSIFESSPVYIYEDEILQLLYNPFSIRFINFAIRYYINNGNIIIYDEIFGYFEDAALYIFSIVDDEYNEDFRKYRFESRFMIDDWFGDNIYNN